METWIASADAQSRVQMVDEALAVHEANGTQDSQLAARLRESREHYLKFVKPGMGDKLVVREQDPQPFTGKSSAARATGTGKSGQASEKALGYATSLWNSRQSDLLQTKNPIMHRAGLRMVEEGKIDPRTCSDLIDLLKALPWRERTSRPAVDPGATPASQTLREAMSEPAPILDPGYYRKGEEFFRVKISRSSGRPYAELWIHGGWDYEAGRGTVRKLTADMVLTAEDAKAFGDQYHACVYCSTQLTDQRSVDAGYGPKCAVKHGLPWG